MNAGAGEEIRVMLVDEHATFRKPLAFMLGREQDLTVVAQAGSLAEAYGVLGDAYLEVDGPSWIWIFLTARV